LTTGGGVGTYGLEWEMMAMSFKSFDVTEKS
jgi:hypothetical protein